MEKFLYVPALFFLLTGCVAINDSSILSIVSESSQNSISIGSSNQSASTSSVDESKKAEVTYDEFRSLVDASTYGSHQHAKIHTKTTKNGATFEEDFSLITTVKHLKYDEEYDIIVWVLDGEPTNPQQTCYDDLKNTSFIVDAKDYMKCCEKTEQYITFSTFYKNPLAIHSLSGGAGSGSSGGGSQSSVSSVSSQSSINWSSSMEIILFYNADLYPYKAVIHMVYYENDSLKKDTKVEGLITYLD